MKSDKEMESIAFEDAMKELENVVQQLEGNNLSLDESLQIFERGVYLSSYCAKKLEEAERKITILTKSHNAIKEEPFEPSEED